MAEQSLKQRTAGSIKWNLIDRLSSQVLYAVTGVVLARLLSQEDFGLVGAVLVFQAFASLLVDSGFAYALIQRKNPTQTDYSTVLWFNMGVAVAAYVVLFAAAPLIARCFEGDQRLIPLSRVMFLSLILNASAIVQTNRLMKRMDVRMVAVSNSIGLVVAAVVGIWLAVAGFGAWAVVWQTIVLSGVKSLVLWTSQSWRPSLVFSVAALKSFFGIGGRMMFTSFLNVLFLNIYSFFIGNRAGLAPLGYYTQSDKWSKMGITSLSQVLTSSFLPALSAVQDDAERFARACSKMNRFTAYLLFPFTLGLMVMATPVFHLLFATKWDASILLFQLLLLRGIFTVLVSLYNNYVLALGHAKIIMWMEILRDSVALIALFATFPWLAETRPDNPVWGISIMLWGQVAASFVTWAAMLVATARRCGGTIRGYLTDLLPYFALTFIAVPLMHWAAQAIQSAATCGIAGVAALQIAAQAAIGLTIYIGLNAAAHSKIQSEVLTYFTKKKTL